MQTQYNRRKVKNFLTKNDTQMRLARHNLLFLIGVMLVLIVVLLSPMYYDMQLSDQLWTQYVSANLLWRLLYRIGTAFLLIIVFAAVYQIVFTHKICGPLVNINHTYKCVIRGDLRRHVRLRRHDYLQPEAALVNRMLDTFKASISEMKKNQEILVSAAAELQLEEKFNHPAIGLIKQVLKANEDSLKFWRVND